MDTLQQFVTQNIILYWQSTEKLWQKQYPLI